MDGVRLEIRSRLVPSGFRRLPRPDIWSSGEIGRHAGLRNQCLRACGFDSCLDQVDKFRLPPSGVNWKQVKLTEGLIGER